MANGCTAEIAPNNADLSQIIKAVGGAASLAALAILLFAVWSTSSFGQWTGTVGNALAIASAAFMVGGLVGFLFGIPRTVQSEGIEVAVPLSSSLQPMLTPPAVSQTTYRENTNLEQISDWLTKILVGVGLTQIRELPQLCVQLSTFLGAALGNSPGAPVFGVSLAVYSAMVGFFFGYLETRLYLMGAFSRAGQSLRGLIQETRELAVSNLETLVFNSLYIDPPQGFQTAIERGEEYLAKHPPNARVFRFLSAAYGQKHHWDREHSATPEQLRQWRNRALEFAKRAIELDNTEKAILRVLWEGTSPRENDLSDFRDDPDFAQLLRQ